MLTEVGQFAHHVVQQLLAERARVGVVEVERFQLTREVVGLVVSQRGRRQSVSGSRATVRIADGGAAGDELVLGLLSRVPRADRLIEESKALTAHSASSDPLANVASDGSESIILSISIAAFRFAIFLFRPSPRVSNPDPTRQDRMKFLSFG